MADRAVDTLNAEHPGGCLGELHNAAGLLDRHGFVGRPDWNSIRVGIRPEGDIHAEPGEWPHGWQYYASSSSEHHFRKNVVLNQSCAADQAHLRSHSGPGASDVLCDALRSQSFELSQGSSEPSSWRESDCPCRSLRFVANVGFHWTTEVATEPRAVGRADSRLGLLLQSTLASVCREAGATVRYNAKLRDMDLAVSANDHRAIEVLATGLPLYFGVQLAVDITLRCALASDGTAQPGAARMDGAVRGHGRTRNGSIRNSSVLTGVASWWLLLKLEDVGARSPSSSWKAWRQ